MKPMPFQHPTTDTGSMRTVLKAALAFGLAVGLGAPAQATQATQAGAVCDKALQPGDIYTFACPVKSLPTGRRAFRFVAELSGGHDDSSSALAVRHGGQDLPCAQGSKTASDGEYGAITLDCRFTLPASAADGQGTIEVTLKASHVVLERADLQPVSAD